MQQPVCSASNLYIETLETTSGVFFFLELVVVAENWFNWMTKINDNWHSNVTRVHWYWITISLLEAAAGRGRASHSLLRSTRARSCPAMCMRIHRNQFIPFFHQKRTTQAIAAIACNDWRHSQSQFTVNLSNVVVVMCVFVCRCLIFVVTRVHCAPHKNTFNCNLFITRCQSVCVWME